LKLVVAEIHRLGCINLLARPRSFLVPQDLFLPDGCHFSGDPPFVANLTPQQASSVLVFFFSGSVAAFLLPVTTSVFFLCGGEPKARHFHRLGLFFERFCSLTLFFFPVQHSRLHDLFLLHSALFFWRYRKPPPPLKLFFLLSFSISDPSMDSISANFCRFLPILFLLLRGSATRLSLGQFEIHK